MAQYDIQDEDGNVVFTVEGDEPPTADEIEELMTANSAASSVPARPAEPKPQPTQDSGLFSAKTLFPAATGALEAPATDKDRQMVQSQLDIQAASPMASVVPGTGMPTPIVSEQSMKAGLGAVGDWFGRGFRLAGSLVPALRGKTTDATTGQERTRTFTEAIQNPQTSLTTPIDEAIDSSSLPNAVKAAGHFVLGAAQGAGAGMAGGAAKGAVKSATAGAREATGVTMTKVADAVQNLRLGATTKDVLDGYTPRTLAKNGLNRQSVPDAYKSVQSKLKDLTNQATAIKTASTTKVNLSKILQELREDINAKKFNFSDKESQDALDDIEAVIQREVQRSPSMAKSGTPFVPRRPIFQLTPEEIKNGLDDGTIRFTTKGNRAVPEYAVPEVVPDNFLPAEGVHMNLLDANLLKTEVGKESAFQHLAGRVRGDKAASAAEKVYNAFYAKLKKEVDPLGGPELQKINREFSELIPVQNVLTRAMTREELGQALGRTDIPTTKFGVVRAVMRATRTDRAAGLNAIGEAIQQSGAQDAAKGYTRSIGEEAAAAALQGLLRGSLAGSQR